MIVNNYRMVFNKIYLYNKDDIKILKNLLFCYKNKLSPSLKQLWPY